MAAEQDMLLIRERDGSFRLVEDCCGREPYDTARDLDSIEVRLALPMCRVHIHDDE